MDLSSDKFLTVILILCAVWAIPWKGVALWKAARRSDPVWYVILLVVNTLGILEILYIFIFSRYRKEIGQK